MSIRYRDKNGHPMTLMEWSRKFEDTEYRFVARTALGEVEEYDISTVWLGLNHEWNDDLPPKIFESMVFVDNDPEWDNHQVRYSTLSQALAGHDKIVRDITKYLKEE